MSEPLSRVKFLCVSTAMTFLERETAKISRTEVYCLRAGELSSSINSEDNDQILTSVLEALIT